MAELVTKSVRLPTPSVPLSPSSPVAMPDNEAGHMRKIVYSGMHQLEDSKHSRSLGPSMGNVNKMSPGSAWKRGVLGATPTWGFLSTPHLEPFNASVPRVWMLNHLRSASRLPSGLQEKSSGLTGFACLPPDAWDLKLEKSRLTNFLLGSTKALMATGLF